MHRDEYLEQLTSDGRRMADLARGDLDAPVPTCPDWTLRDLVEHTGFVHRWQTAAVRDDVAAFPDEATWRHGPAEGESWADWFQAGVDSAVAVMSQVGPDEPRWTWSAPQGGETAQWYFRRIALETLVHRIDAELTAGVDVSPFDPAFAVDGIDELFFMMLPISGPEPIGGNGETVHLHATDVEGEWLVTLLAESATAVRGHAKGDAAIRGAARDLLLQAWGRDPLGELEVFGDEGAVAKFRAAAKL